MKSALKLSVFLLVLVAMNMVYQKAAEARKEHAAHVHGAAKLDIAIEKNEIDLDFDIPGNDVVGFEHKPKSLAEKEKATRILRKLNESFTVVALPAGCTVKEHKAEVSYKKDHSEYEMEAEFTCADVATVKTLEVTAFKEFPSLKELEVTVVTTAGTKTYKLTPTNTAVAL